MALYYWSGFFAIMGLMLVVSSRYQSVVGVVMTIVATLVSAKSITDLPTESIPLAVAAWSSGALLVAGAWCFVLTGWAERPRIERLRRVPLVCGIICLGGSLALKLHVAFASWR